jgi:hypothetical protein
MHIFPGAILEMYENLSKTRWSGAMTQKAIQRKQIDPTKHLPRINVPRDVFVSSK